MTIFYSKTLQMTIKEVCSPQNAIKKPTFADE